MIDLKRSLRKVMDEFNIKYEFRYYLDGIGIYLFDYSIEIKLVYHCLKDSEDILISQIIVCEYPTTKVKSFSKDIKPPLYNEVVHSNNSVLIHSDKNFKDYFKEQFSQIFERIDNKKWKSLVIRNLLEWKF